jgi:RimJ/RimL family protein N-acetyltransferase
MQSKRLSLSADIDFETAMYARNHESIRRWCRQYTLISEADQLDWARKVHQDPTIQMFAILDADDNQVGVCGFTSIDRHNRSAEFSVYINPDNQGFGYGAEGLGMLLDHGFEDFGFHRIWGEVFMGNPAIKTFQALGFKFSGRMRHSYYRNGAFIDSILIDLLEHEWKLKGA